MVRHALQWIRLQGRDPFKAVRGRGQRWVLGVGEELAEVS